MTEIILSHRPSRRPRPSKFESLLRTSLIVDIIFVIKLEKGPPKTDREGYFCANCENRTYYSRIIEGGVTFGLRS